MNKTISIEAVAKICHEANRAYCQSLGDLSQQPWDEAPEWQRSSAIKGVSFHVANPLANASASHECWLEEKRSTGWTYGPVKDAEKKEHPCFRPFLDLPIEQQAKDMLFKHVVDSLRHIIAPLDAEPDNAKFNLKRYQSHKVVEAAKIINIKADTRTAGWYLHSDCGNIYVSQAYINKHNPQPGGYYVHYEDGYESFSPAAAFESGYTLIQ